MKCFLQIVLLLDCKKTVKYNLFGYWITIWSANIFLYLYRVGSIDSIKLKS